MEDYLKCEIKGHCKIVDDLGNILLDKHNAIHPQNMARIVARSLANEHNNFIHRIAFGNGGTDVDSAFTITYRTPNDGQSPDISTWDSRIYNETFSKIIDDGRTTLNPNIGKDPGSADLNTGIRVGGGSVPSSDPVTVPHVSGPGVRSVDLGLISEVVISATINSSEPKSQFNTDLLGPLETTNSSFVFDEIGLYTSGTSAVNTSGYQQIDVGSRTSIDDTGLVNNTTYSFTISVDGGSPVSISFTTPALGGSGLTGQILYGDLCQAINTGSVSWGFSGVSPLPGGAQILISDPTGGTFSTIVGAVTYGFLTFMSGSSGVASRVVLDDPSWTIRTTVTSFLPAINFPQGGALMAPVTGTIAGLQNAPTTPTLERERLLAHLIFSPILKTATRVLNLTYTITVMIARTTG